MDSDLLRMIIRLSIESSSLNAVLSHKVLQNVLRMSAMNDFILENAVGKIERNSEFYPEQRDLVFKRSQTLQIFFNQVYKRTDRMGIAKAELLRTLKSIQLFPSPRFDRLKFSLKSFLTTSFNRIDQLTTN